MSSHDERRPPIGSSSTGRGESPADEGSDWRPTATWELLRKRVALLHELRAFFDGRGFLEVDTPILSTDTVVDRHIDPFAVPLGHGAAGEQMLAWLQTSPEFAMKRLMAAGGEAIYQVTHAFRRHEAGTLHNPEFTIVEWYRRGDAMADGMRLLSEFCQSLLGTPPAVPLAYRAAFDRYASVDPVFATLGELADAAHHHGVAVPASMAAADRDTWLDLLLVSLVEPRLGQDAPVILHDYPQSQAALAVVRPEHPPVAERFELYVRGIELANGYHELLDAEVLRARIHANNAARATAGKSRLPEESRLLAAMEHGLPGCTGVALGFDRLVMLATGAKNLAEVMAFPFDRA
ncbi:MAG: EF-P lysine aminoacylase GenX [Planctomycetia bacterium]|nr:EF-P lysine aminoacylase GenX [Planctomycetia bacterium]